MGIESLLFAGLSAAGGMMATRGAAKQAKANAMSSILELQGMYEQVAIQNEQLLQETDSIKIAADLAMNERVEQNEKIKRMNRSFMSSSGLAANFSAQVAERVGDVAMRKDIQTTQYNAAGQRAKISDQIKVNRMSLKYGGYRAATNISNGFREATATGQQAVISTLTSLLKYSSSPGGGGGGGGGSTGKLLASMMGG
jgi:hypothetical protein